MGQPLSHSRGGVGMSVMLPHRAGPQEGSTHGRHGSFPPLDSHITLRVRRGQGLLPGKLQDPSPRPLVHVSLGHHWPTGLCCAVGVGAIRSQKIRWLWVACHFPPSWHGVGSRQRAGPRVRSSSESTSSNRLLSSVLSFPIFPHLSFIGSLFRLSRGWVAHSRCSGSGS